MVIQTPVKTDLLTQQLFELFKQATQTHQVTKAWRSMPSQNDTKGTEDANYCDVTAFAVMWTLCRSVVVKRELG